MALSALGDHGSQDAAPTPEATHRPRPGGIRQSGRPCRPRVRVTYGTLEPPGTPSAGARRGRRVGPVSRHAPPVTTRTPNPGTVHQETP